MSAATILLFLVLHTTDGTQIQRTESKYSTMQECRAAGATFEDESKEEKVPPLVLGYLCLDEAELYEGTPL